MQPAKRKRLDVEDSPAPEANAVETDDKLEHGSGVADEDGVDTVAIAAISPKSFKDLVRIPVCVLLS